MKRMLLRFVGYAILVGLLATILWQVEPMATVLLGIIVVLFVLEIASLLVKNAFGRFDDTPRFTTESGGKISVESVSIGRLKGWLVKSDGTPSKEAPCVIMHHGYGSHYRRMLPYAYPVALAGHAVLLYNAWGHGKIVRAGGKRIDERSPGHKHEIMQILHDLDKAVAMIESRDDLGEIGFVGISLGAIVGLTRAAANPKIKCVIALAGIHDFKETAKRPMKAFFSQDWWTKKGFEWSGLEMDPTDLQDNLVSPRFYHHKQLGFFGHPVWDDADVGEKIYLIHAMDDKTVPYFNFLENIDALGLPPEHVMGLESGNHWFVRQEHLIIGQVLKWLGERLGKDAVA